MISLPTHFSLVKYSTPVLVSVAKKSTKGQKPQGSPRSGGVQIKEKNRTEDILNKIIPPKEYSLTNKQLWVQTVLSTPATRTEVLTLFDELDKRLVQKQARETGICPIREELYEQCFDELIRQMTIDCKERGLLLVEVRDEIKRQLSSYKTLYESSIAYGMRKMIESVQAKTQMHDQIIQLETECEELTRYVEELEKKTVQTKEQENARLEAENQAHKEEVQRIKDNNFQVKDKLEKHLARK